ncbi:MAG TPA: HAMP domain-containing sensor histidine kinase, partial [Acidobacteriaceae bacterium]
GLRELRPAGATVTITDHGTGIAPETLDRLFQPFFTTKGERGTGLGLWVSQGIAQKHGGDIHLDTRTGPDNHGTTVSVFLPRGTAPGSSTPSADAEPELTADLPAKEALSKPPASVTHADTAAPLSSR